MITKIKPQVGCYFSPLRYPGGKTSLLPFLDRVVKVNNLYNGTYLEPFAGGAGAAVGLLLLEKVERIIINDLDPAIYAFWKAAIEQSDKFVEKIFKMRISMAEWRRQKTLYHDKRASLFNLGFAAFYLNRTNHSGIIGGGPIGGIKQKGPWGIKARFNKEVLAEKIARIACYKNRIKICNEDGLKLLSKYRRHKTVFSYLDPPYYVKGSCLYLNHYQPNDHVTLAKYLNKNNRAKWILTYDNVLSIRRLYPKRRSQSFSLNYSARNASKGKEIMIFSDALALPN